jgi:dynein heavy chain
MLVVSACRELVPVDRLSSVRTFARLFDALATKDNGVSLEDGPESFAAVVELWFLFSMIWGLGGSLDEEGRKKFDRFMR